MSQICICLLLLFTSVYSYPITNYEYDAKNSDNIDFPNEFWTQHFGLDFKDAVHFDLQPTDFIDAGNNLDRHIPESQDNTHKKRSAYVVHTPQVPKQQNHTVQSSMKVHLLEPAEIEALEKQMLNYAKENKMSESPVVVNLPATEDLTSKSVDEETPMVLNVPPVVYHSNPNSVHSHYFENAKGIWSKNPKVAAYHHDHRAQYHQLPKPSYEKMIMMQKQQQQQQQQELQQQQQQQYQQLQQELQQQQQQQHQQLQQHQQQQHQHLQQQQQQQQELLQQQQEPSYEKIIHSLNEKNSQPSQEIKTVMGHHSFEKMVQSSFEKPTQSKQEKTMHASHEMMVMQPSIGNMMQPSLEQITQPLSKAVTVQPLYEKTTQSPIIEKKQPSSEKTTESPFEQIQNSYSKMMQPSYENMQPSLEQIEAAYAKMMHSSFDKMEPTYEQIHPTPTTYDFKKLSPFEGSVMHPSYENTRMFPYGGTPTSRSMFPSYESMVKTYEATDQSLKNAENIPASLENKQRALSFEDVLGVKHENHDKTTSS